MKVALLTNVISPHQIPLAKELVEKLGAESYRYIYTEPLESERVQLGWNDASDDQWCVQSSVDDPFLMEADVVFSELRALDLFEKRIAAGKVTIYISERWFKPPIGFLRVLFPSYFRMAKRFAKIFDSPLFFYYPQGIHAARDMIRLLLLLHGKMKYLFFSPKVVFDSEPGGKVALLEDAVKVGVCCEEQIKCCRKNGFVSLPKVRLDKIENTDLLKKIKIWGYFVQSSNHFNEKLEQ